MGKIYAVEYVTLDGVFEEPGWSGPFFNEELQNWQFENTMTADVQLLGRKTFEGFMEAWRAMEAETGEFGRKFNAMPKRVATTTLTTPEWNATFIEGDVTEAVRALKEEYANIVVNGSGTLLNHLARHNLVDEFRIMTFPVVLVGSRKLWTEGTTLALSLADSWTTKSGVAVQTYVPA